MKVLVACEESQTVCKAFLERGHEAYSNDLQKCSGGVPDRHILMDARAVMNGGVMRLETGKKIEIDKWDLIIAHPPCTYLTISATRHHSLNVTPINWINARTKQRILAMDFFMDCVNANADRIAVENPVGIMNTTYRQPDQIIQPYQFGHPVSKKTCLWLKNLPPLIPTELTEPEMIHSKGESGGYSGPSWIVRDENGKILPYTDPRVAKERSKTYQGIADAMAIQWGWKGETE